MTATHTAANTTPPVTAATAEPQRQDNAEIPTHPSDILVELVVGVLAPLFMAGCSGDLNFARLAAIETINAYQAKTQAELVMIAQIIGFGLAAMDNLRLSMDPGLSLSMKLRLRGGANALNRAAQQNVRALEKIRRHDNLPAAPSLAEAAAYPDAAPDADELTLADVEATIAQARTMVKEAYGRLQDVPPDAAPPAKVPAGVQPPRAATQQENPAWIKALSNVAAELNGERAAVMPTLRRADLLQATSLSSIPGDLTLAARDALLRAETSRKPR